MLAPLAFIPSMGNVMRILILVLGFVSTWIRCAAAAHETSGWRTVLLPVITYVILIAGFVIASLLLTGLEVKIDAVLVSLGIQTP